MTLHGGAMTADLNGPERKATPGRGGARLLGVSPPVDRERAFAGARRRSTRVRFLRSAILVGGLGTVAAMIMIAVFDPFSAKFGPLSFSALSVDGTKITMARPKLAGFRSDGQPYSLTAEKALQDIKHPTIVELQKVSGEISGADGETTEVVADTGIYDSVGEKMQLSDNVRIGNARFEVRLRRADIDFKTGVYQSDEPVEIHVGQDTTIFADRAVARDNGKELAFEGHVRTKIVPQADQTADADARGKSQ